MFVLRKVHEEAFKKASLQRFSKKVLRMLRRDHPQAAATLNQVALLNQIDLWINFSRDSGIKLETDLYKICEASLSLHSIGIDSMSVSWFRQLLQRTDICAATRAEQLKITSVEYCKRNLGAF